MYFYNNSFNKINLLKTCKATNCNSPVFSNGYCKYHQFKNPKRKQYKYKVTPLGEYDMFKEIWKEKTKIDGKHYSEISGRLLDHFINSPFFFNIFAHILSKNQYPKYRLNKDNIMIVHPEEHVLIDQGTVQKRKDYTKHHKCHWIIFYEKQLALKQEYDNKYRNRTTFQK